MLFHTLLSKLERFEMLIITLLTFFTAGLGYFVFRVMSREDRAHPIAFLKYLFPVEHWRHKSVQLDVIFYFASKVSDKIIGLGGTILMVAGATAVAAAFSHLVPGHWSIKPNLFEVVGLSIAFFLFVDLANYLSHLLQHKVPMLWEFHKVHHSALFLTPLTTARMHPFGNEFDGLLAAVLTAIPVGVAKSIFNLSFAEVAVMIAAANFAGTVMVLDTLRHSHFPVSFGPLDKVLMSPHMHQLHHSVKKEHWDKNLGNKLSLWDWMFKTGFKPVKGERLYFGVGTVEDSRGDYATLVGCYVGPFVKNYRMVVRWAQGKSLSAEEKAAMVLAEPFHAPDRARAATAPSFLPEPEARVEIGAFEPAAVG